MAQKASPRPLKRLLQTVDIASVVKNEKYRSPLPQAAQLIEPEKICISCQPSQAGTRMINQTKRLRVYLKEPYFLSI